MKAGLRAFIAAAVVGIGGASGFYAAHHASLRDHPGGLVPSSGAAIVNPDEGGRGDVAAAPGGARPLQPDGDEPPATSATPRAIPELVPDITLPDGNGSRHRLAEWKGRPLVINFWATWCAPCRREIPLLKSLRHVHSAEGLEVIGIAVDFRDAVRQYSQEMGIDYPLLVGEQDGLEAIAAFGMDTVFPFTVFADRQGRIVTLKVGELHPEDAELILGRMQAADQGRLALGQARREIADGMAALATHRALAEARNPSDAEVR